MLSKVELTRIQALQLELLVELDRLCRRHGLIYSLAYGTLLGAIRHGGFIPWDDDVDIMLPRADYERLRQVCAQELDSKKYFYQSRQTDPEYHFLYDKIRINNTLFKEAALAPHAIHHGLYLDIFPVDFLPENLWLRKWHSGRFQWRRNVLMAKYLNLKTRHGAKWLAARGLRWLFKNYELTSLASEAEALARQSPASAVCGILGYQEVFNTQMLQECVDWEFAGHKLAVPKNYASLLKQLYGDYQTWPTDSERQTRHDLVAYQLLGKE